MVSLYVRIQDVLHTFKGSGNWFVYMDEYKLTVLKNGQTFWSVRYTSAFKYIVKWC